MHTILVVDDEQDIQELITTKFRKQIRRQELCFLFAHDGEEALKYLDQHPETSIILTDLNMPRMDGLTLLKNLQKSHESGKNGHNFSGHAIVITAYGDYDRQRAAMHNGAFDFLNKPLDFTDLETTLTRSLETQRKLQDKIWEIQQHNQDLHARNSELTARNQELERKLMAAYARIEALEVQTG